MMHRVNSTLLEKRLDEATATGQWYQEMLCSSL